ncbi:MAG: mono/diheme cytochrome c family protein [Limisphaerales bacterium]|jgi:mono/diheme cytochrome c family protein
MSDESKQTNDPTVDEREPTAGDVSAPIWLMVLLIVLLWVAFLFLDRRGGGFHEEVYRPYPSIAYVKDLSVTDPPQIVRGREQYKKSCASCHGATGAGSSGVAPPLAGSDWVQAEGPQRIARVVMNGLKGPIKVNEVPFAGPAGGMMSVGLMTKFDEVTLADVLSYIRASEEFGNGASMVTPEEIAEAFAAATARGQTQWTEDEIHTIEIVAPK